MSTAVAQSSVVASAAGSGAAAAPAPERSDRLTRRWLTGFVVANICFQIGLFSLGDTFLRMPMRMGLYVTSLSFLFLVRRTGWRHPAAGVFVAAAVILVLSLMNPDTQPYAGVAQIALYLSVLAPLIWCQGLRIDRTVFERVVYVIWGFYAASAIVGALQVKFPGTFDGALSNNYDDYHVKAMTIQMADGTQMLRPKGLTDVAGGAGDSGTYAVILGMGVLLMARSGWARAGVITIMTIGLFGIFLSHVRTLLIIAAVAAATMLFILNKRRRFEQASLLMTVIVGIVLAAATLSFSIGGEATVARWASLLEDDPGSVYYKNRGFFLDELVNRDVFNYPLGAGGGRWGMLNVYFGQPDQSVWAEMMWQALLYDGGVPLIVTYLILLFVLVNTSWKIATTDPRSEVAIWAGVVTSFTVATFVASFGFPIYIKPVGLEMILMNVCLYGYHLSGRRPSRVLPAATLRGPVGVVTGR